MTCCPLCGGEMHDAGITILADRGLLVRGNLVTVLTGGELAVFNMLYKSRPRVLSRSQLLEGLYDLEQDEAEIKIIDVFVCKANKKIKPLGLTIKNEWGKGYWLKFEEAVPVKYVEAAA